MADFVVVGNVGDFVSGQGKMVVVNGRHVAVFRLGDDVHALDNLCLHRGGPLCEGQIDNSVVTCPWHGWSYEITTGMLVQDPRVGVNKHDVKIEAGVISIRVIE